MKLLPLFLLAACALSGEIVSAYGHLPGGGVRVPLPESQVPWKDLATRIVGADVATPSDSRLTDLWQNKDSFGAAEVTFQAPIPDAMKNRKYYLISVYGLSALRVRGMVGSVRYGFDPQGTKSDLKQIGFSGNAIFDFATDDDIADGAFLIDAESPLKSDAADVEPAKVTLAKDGEAARVTYDGKSGTIKTPVTSRPEDAALITIEADRYLYLHWLPEGTSCEYMYTLMKISGDSLQEAGSTVYGCDAF